MNTTTVDTSNPTMQSSQDSTTSSWKTKLSEQQLKRKRGADREGHRESRNRAKETIASLEERIRLLASPDQLLMSLLDSNAALESQRNALQNAVEASFAAFGIMKDESRDILARLSRTQHQTSATSVVAAARKRTAIYAPPSSRSPELLQRSEIDLECDRRMQILDQLSPFTQMCKGMGDGMFMMQFPDEEILSAIISWQRTNERGVSTFDLACELFHVERFPSEIQEQDKLNQKIRSPAFFQDIITELSIQSTGDIQAENRASVYVVVDEIARKRREMIACALEATRGWVYRSKVERLVMFWAVYRIIMLLIFPTMQNLTKCPRWYRPLASQFSHPHPNWVDFIPWPLMRDRLIHEYRQYQDTDFMSNLLANLCFDSKWQTFPEPLISVNAAGTDIVLHPLFQVEVENLRSFQMGPSFLESFPELSMYVYKAPKTAEAPPTNFDSSQSVNDLNKVTDLFGSSDLGSSQVPEIGMSSTSSVDQSASSPDLMVPAATAVTLGKPDYHVDHGDLGYYGFPLDTPYLMDDSYTIHDRDGMRFDNISLGYPV